MEDSKYYTPRIEEFHVGFEFEEEFHAPNWNKLIKPPKDLYEWVHLKLDTSHSISRITSKIKKSKVRVKYLDQEDIESLGFKFMLDAGVEIWFEEQKEIYSLYLRNRGSVKITKKIEEDFIISLFEGKIKNKSELKKILKQIGYGNES